MTTTNMYGNIAEDLEVKYPTKEEREEYELNKASRDFSEMIGILVSVMIFNTKFGRSVILIAVWLSAFNYVDKRYRVGDKLNKVGQFCRDVWNS